MRRILYCVVVAGLAFAGCTGPGRDLVTTAKQLDVMANAHDADGFSALLTDNVVAKSPDGTTHSGKDSVRAWIKGLMPGFHVDSHGFQQSGDTVSWMSTVHSDAFASMGLNPIKTNTMAVFDGNKVRYFEAAFDRETSGKLRFLQFYADVINGGNDDAIDNYLAPDFVEHQQLPPGTPTGREGVKSFFRMVHQAFPDLHGTPVLVMADGDLVLIWARWEGTDKGKFMGQPPTNKKLSWTVADVVRIVDGKATEHWGSDDMAMRMMESRRK
jgi:predicted SnoaL-like aldol condensation-catalyzing enzyme